MTTTTITPIPPPITFPLGLRAGPAAIHQPAAWFVPGGDPAAWLDEVARWGLPMSDLRLYVVPASARDRAPVGALVTVPPGKSPRSVRRARAYGVLAAGRLFLPAEAALHPPASEAELRDRLLWDVQVLHPSAGLAGFRAADALGVHDLLTPPPPRRDADWAGAAVGADDEPGWRLLAVEPEQVPGAAEVLQQGRDDIGSAAGEPLPRTPDESALKEWARRAALPPLALGRLAALAPITLLSWLGGLLPQGPNPGGGGGSRGPGRAGGPGEGGGRLEELQRRMLGKFAEWSKSLYDARLRELERLRRMLENDPDEALRHAIPLRDVGTRGVAPPGASLMPRDPLFSLAGLRGGGGRAGDAWVVPADFTLDLSRRYRDAANRELRLGRYRRAAYIFAELLGDWAAAANALEQGRHYREAAVLYREHLHNPLKAAECLERGGLLAEAAPAYEELAMFEKAGDLYARIERPDDAARCYRTQVQTLTIRHDFPAAARLLETKLAAPDEALDVLTAAWPASDSSGVCLNESFRLLARLARHDEASARVRRLRTGPPPTAGRGAVLTKVLADVATSYPEQNVRPLAADAARVVAGRLLSEADTGLTSADRQTVARAVGRLAPEDRLLSRDVERFLAPPGPPPRAPAVPAAARGTARGSGDPVVVRQFHLPEAAAWHAAAAEGEGFYALAATDAPPALLLVRGLWDGRTQAARWPAAAAAGLPPPGIGWSLHPVPGQPRVTVTDAAVAAGLAGAAVEFPPTDTFPRRAQVSRPGWLPPQVLAVGHSEAGLTWVLHPGTTEDVLSAFRSDTGALVASHVLTGLGPPLDGDRRLLALACGVFATWGSAVLHFSPARRARLEPTPGPVRRLAACESAAGENHAWVAAAMDEGAVLLGPGGTAHPFADDLSEAHVAFTRGGVLVAAGGGGVGHVYQVDAGGGRPRRRGGFEVPGTLVALTATNRRNEFATFDAGGKVVVYQVPA
jgi:tetratricopeptide (TPR) repeat protein